MEFFKPGRVFDFMGQRWFWIPLSIVLVLASVVLSFVPGPNYGTDFRGGTEVELAFAKPIDAGLMAQLAAEHDLLVTVEEGVLAGGFGSAVWETLNETGLTSTPRIIRVGLPDRYVTHGKPQLLHEEIGFTGPRIAKRVRAALLARDSAALQA